MSDNNKERKDPRDIERRPPELRSNRRRSSSEQSARRQSSAQDERRSKTEKTVSRSVDTQAKNTESNSAHSGDVRKKAAAAQEERLSKAVQDEQRSKTVKDINLLVDIQAKNTGSNSARSGDVRKKAAAASREYADNSRNIEKTGNASKSQQIPTKSGKETAKSGKAPTHSEKENSPRLTEQEKRLEMHKKAILRQSRKREYSLQCFNIAVIVAVFSLITLFINFNYSNRPKVDEDERRKLAQIPEFTWQSYFDGSFTSGFSAWFNDTVPSRSTFKNFISLFRSHLGIDYDGGVTIIGPMTPVEDPGDDPTSSSNDSKPTDPDNSGKPQQSGSGSTSDPTSTSTSTGKPVVNPQDADGDMSGTVFVLGNGQGFSMFGGNKAGGREYADSVNEIKARLGDGVNVYSMVIPTAGSFYLPEKYKSKMASEWDGIEDINNHLVGVTPIDAYSALAAHSGEYIYFRTDHHWTQLGAYYAAEQFAKAAGVPYAALSEYDVQEREGMLGSLYGYSKNNPNMKKNPDTFTFYKPKNEYTVTVYDPDYTNPRKMPLILSDAYVSVNNSYMVYGGDIQINHVETDCKNGRKLVIIGDSYDNAMFLNLTNSFEEIWVVDMRAHMETPFFDLNIIDFIQKMEATDVLFAMDTFSAVGGNRRGLQTMLNNPKTLPEN